MKTVIESSIVINGLPYTHPRSPFVDSNSIQSQRMIGTHPTVRYQYTEEGSDVVKSVHKRITVPKTVTTAELKDFILTELAK